VASVLKRPLKNVGKADSSGLKPLGMTKINSLCGTAKAVPFQNLAQADFFSARL
jgi:hypothetical protein